MSNIFEDAKIKIPTLAEFDKRPLNEPVKAIAKLSNHNGWTWYVVAGDKVGDNDVYCYGYVESPITSEWGMFMLSEVLTNGGMLALMFKGAILK